MICCPGFNVVETAQFTEPAHVLYTIHTIDLSQGDTQAINADNTHLPKPVIRPNAKWSFQVPLTSSLRYMLRSDLFWHFELKPSCVSKATYSFLQTEGA